MRGAVASRLYALSKSSYSSPPARCVKSLRDASHSALAEVSCMNEFLKFCRLQLGLKSVIDYAQYRSRLLGVRDLSIHTIFDIGANVGKKSKLFRRLFPEATIHSFEPLPDCFEKLDAWASKQQGRVQTYHLALGSQPGMTTMHCDHRHPGDHVPGAGTGHAGPDGV